MFGYVVVTHGGLARALMAAVEHVVGPQARASAVCIDSTDDMELKRAEILAEVRSCDSGDGVVVLSDMFGGTPSNLAISMMDVARVEVLAGVNLPMLIKLAGLRDLPIAEAVRLVQEAGRKYIMVVSHMLSAAPA